MTKQQIGTPMNRATRVLLMSGLAVAAGAAFGSAPALAAPASTSGTGATVQSAPRRTWVQNHYRTYNQCRTAGRIGEFAGRWNWYDCDFVTHGRFRGSWELTVGWTRPGHGHGPWWHCVTSESGAATRESGGPDSRDTDVLRRAGFRAH